MSENISKVTAKYDADSLRLLEGRDHVRQRPAMYIGDTGTAGLHHLMFEIVDNSVDEVLAGRASEIWVTLHRDNSISVRDNGNGIPTGINRATGLSGLELAMTKLNAGGKFGDEGYKVSGGLHGVGLSCVNFLSEWCVAIVDHDGTKSQLVCKKGVSGELKSLGKTNSSGTIIRWLPDSEIFGNIVYYPSIFEERIKNTCYLTPEVTIHWNNEFSNEGIKTFHYSEGISALVSEINTNRQALHEPAYISRVIEGIQIDLSMQYSHSSLESVLSFANNVNTADGGTHVSGFKTSLTRTVNAYAKKTGFLKDKDPNFSGDDIRDGLTAVISVRLPNPQFQGQTKSKLANSEVESIVSNLVSEFIGDYLIENPVVAHRIIHKIQTTQKAREAARKAAEFVKRSSGLDSFSLPGKLADCTEKDPRNCELFIVEGDSAGGSAKTGRDRRYQAILPMRGKILNVGKAELDRAIDNNEIRSLITALGTGIDYGDLSDMEGISGSLDINKLRYNRIVIMTDADVDGDHIRTLLLTFFFTYMQPLVEYGHIYVAQPPLYSIKWGKDNRRYAKNQKELEVILARAGKNAKVGRFKGLGEMNPDELYETTMNIKTRTISQVTMDDADRAHELFKILMGSYVEPRKNYIIRYAREVSNVDWHC